MVDNLSVKHVYDELFELLKEVKTNLEIQKFDFDNIKEEIHQESEVIKNSLNKIENGLDQFKKNLNDFFDSVEEPYYKESQEIYKSILQDTADYTLDQYKYKKLVYEEETLQFLINRVKLQVNWKWPAMELRPALGEFSDVLIGCDPLYLVDTDAELFAEVKQLWTPEYQRRIRYYTIDESVKMPLGVLPQNQFGLILSINFFNFRPLDIIEKYLTGMFNTLKPGGVAIFTFNNCDYPIGVDNFENGYYCYTPGRVIKELCIKQGFKILSSFDMENNVSWIEIQKPGNRISLRGGQNLAKIQNLTNNASPQEQQSINQANSVGKK